VPSMFKPMAHKVELPNIIENIRIT
jgi:hypothetical protein